MYLYSYLSFAPAPLLDIFSFYVCLGQRSRNRSLGGDVSFDAVRLQTMLQTSSQGRYPFFYPQCPVLAFYGNLTGYWATCLVGYISGDNSQFSWHSASVLLPEVFPVPVIRLSEFY